MTLHNTLIAIAGILAAYFYGRVAIWIARRLEGNAAQLEPVGHTETCDRVPAIYYMASQRGYVVACGCGISR